MKLLARLPKFEPRRENIADKFEMEITDKRNFRHLFCIKFSLLTGKLITVFITTICKKNLSINIIVNLSQPKINFDYHMICFDSIPKIIFVRKELYINKIFNVKRKKKIILLVGTFKSII